MSDNSNSNNGNNSERIMRVGKTKRDRENGAKGRNLSNKDARVAWQKGSRESNNSFPLYSCNGKKSRALKSK